MVKITNAGSGCKGLGKEGQRAIAVWVLVQEDFYKFSIIVLCVCVCPCTTTPV